MAVQIRTQTPGELTLMLVFNSASPPARSHLDLCTGSSHSPLRPPPPQANPCSHCECQPFVSQEACLVLLTTFWKRHSLLIMTRSFIHSHSVHQSLLSNYYASCSEDTAKGHDKLPPPLKAKLWGPTKHNVT